MSKLLLLLHTFQIIKAFSNHYCDLNQVTMSDKYKVLISSSEFPEIGLEMLRNKVTILMPKTNGFDSNTIDECRNEVMTLIEGVDAVIWCSMMNFGKEFLDRAGDKLKVVAGFSAGTDHFDIEQLKSRRIPLTNTPYVLDDAVAELAILLILGTARRVMEGIELIKCGDWDLGPQKRLGHQLKGSTVGVIGFGRIGQTIVKKLQGFGVNEFIYSGHKEKSEGASLGAKFVTFDELLCKSDFVILSCNLNESTKTLMTAEVFNKMKNTAILVNVSRGAVIDQDALVYALKNKIIFGAGLDVMTPEPIPKDHPLVSLPNCFLTPHMGSGTVNTRNEMARLCALNALLGIVGEKLLSPVFEF